MKEYRCNKKMFFWKVTIPALFALFLLVICAAVSLYSNYRLLLGLVGLVCVYVIWNTVVTSSYPDRIVIRDKSIAFFSYGKCQEYFFDQIKQFRVRDTFYSKDMFIRINDPAFYKGRFWLNADYFNQGEELHRFILTLEYKIHPSSLKAMARNR